VAFLGASVEHQNSKPRSIRKVLKSKEVLSTDEYAISAISTIPPFSPNAKRSDFGRSIASDRRTGLGLRGTESVAEGRP
jgi:hypothetical protein